MARKAARQQEALRRARQRQRAQDQREWAATTVGECAAPSDAERRDAVLAQVGPRRRAALTCGWCKGPIEPKTRGRIPKWCSATCRQRAWEQDRAARSGRAAVEIMERQVPVPTPTSPRHLEWASVLEDLAHQLDTGAIYHRDVQPLARALNDVLAAFERRTSPTAREGRS